MDYLHKFNPQIIHRDLKSLNLLLSKQVFTGTKYDEKVDVYSYGMILFEIICREIPFEEEEPAAVGRLAVQGARPDLEAVPPDCPAFLKDLMIICWAHEPTK